MADIIQFRRDTLERWAEYNPTLAEGEIGFVLGSKNQYKVGDGVHAWNDLPLKGFNGNIVDTFASNDEEKDFDAVISQGGLSTIFKYLINNSAHINLENATDFTILNNFNSWKNCGFYVITIHDIIPCYYMLVTADNMFHGVYQWIFGNLQIDEDGQIRGSHWDGRAHIIFRYKGNKQDIWGEWKYYQQGFIKDSLEETDEDNSLFSPSIKCLNSEIEKINSRYNDFKNDITLIVENIAKQLSDFNYKYKQEITQNLIPKFDELSDTVENMMKTMSETEYANLAVKNPETVYLIYEDEE